MINHQAHRRTPLISSGSVGNNWLISVVAFALLVLLPLSFAPKLILGKDMSIFLVWREFIVFVLPLSLLLIPNFRFTLVWSDFVFGGLLLVLVCHALLSGISLLQTGIGALTYCAVIYLRVVFRALRLGVLRWMVWALFVGTAVGGIGLAVDYVSGFKISAQLYSAGLELIEMQSTTVKRTMFLYSGQNTAATHLTLSINCICLVVIMFEKQLSKRVLVSALCVVAVAVYGVFFTFSLAGFIGLALTLMPLAFFSRKRFSTMAVFGGSALAVFLIFSIFGKSDEMDHALNRFQNIIFTEGFDGESEGGRLSAWSAGVREVPRNLLFGTGIGTGNTRSANQGFVIFHYESYPLAILNEGGLFAFIIALFPFYAPLFVVSRIRGIEWSIRLYIYYNLVISLLLVSVNPTAFGFEFSVVALLKLAILHYAASYVGSSSAYRSNVTNQNIYSLTTPVVGGRQLSTVAGRGRTE